MSDLRHGSGERGDAIGEAGRMRDLVRSRVSPYAPPAGYIRFAEALGPAPSGDMLNMDMNGRLLGVGDLVRRDRDDIWRITDIPDNYRRYEDRARCVCVRAPLGWLKPNGQRTKPWARVGDEDSFVIADLVWLPPEALAADEARDSNEPNDGGGTADIDLTGLGSFAAIRQEISAGLGGGDQPFAEYRRVDIEQTRGPTLEFCGKLLCDEAFEISEPDPRSVRFQIYLTQSGSLVAVTSTGPADGEGDRTVTASVVEPGEDVQAAHFAVLDHFDWNPHARTMVVERLGWSLHLEVG